MKAGYRVPFRRRLEGKTDYRKRLRMLKSHKPRVVVRKSSRQITLQLVNPSEKGDVTLATVRSSELGKYGYEGSTGNSSAAYLTGLLFGRRIKEVCEEAILDIGMQPSTKGSRIYAALKGVLDAGFSIPCDDSLLPGDDRIKPDKIASVKTKIMEAK